MFKIFQTQHKASNANFHTGKLVYAHNKEFNWIYDCGSITLARQYLKSIKKIDLIFISHFDKDHIKALPMLLSDLKTQNAKIIVPYLTNEDIAILFFTNFSSSLKVAKHNVSFLKFINQLNTTQRHIDENSKDKKEIIDLSDNTEINDERKIIPIKAGSNYSLGIQYTPAKKLWIFETHVFKESLLKQKLQALLYGISFEEELRNNFNKFIQNFRKEYANIIGDIKKSLKREARNVMTMSMISSPYQSSMPCSHNSFSAWLHTGDAYLADSDIYKEFHKFIEPYRNNIAYCVLPHHASIKSSCTRLYKALDAQCYYIITPSSYVLFSRPHLKNLFSVNKSNFETISCICCQCCYPQMYCHAVSY